MGLDAATWSIIGSIATVVVTVLALIGAALALRRNAQAVELQVLEGIFRDLRGLDREYLATFHEMTKAEKNAWSTAFFNTVEYLCFVVNRGFVPNKRLRAFFFESALLSWRTLFEEHQASGVLTVTSGMFTEFQAAFGKVEQDAIARKSWWASLMGWYRRPVKTA